MLSNILIHLLLQAIHLLFIQCLPHLQEILIRKILTARKLYLTPLRKVSIHYSDRFIIKFHSDFMKRVLMFL